MNQLSRTVEHITAWENKQISDFKLIQNLKEIIMELSDAIIKSETEKAELIGTLGIALDDERRKIYKELLVETFRKYSEAE